MRTEKALDEVIKDFARIMRREHLTYNQTRYCFSQARKLADVKPEKKVKRLPELLSSQEMESLMRTIRDSGNLLHYRLFEFIANTGVRVSEALNIEIKDVDTIGNKVFIRQGKGGKDRYILYPERICTLVLWQIELGVADGNRWLFENDRLHKPYSSRAVEKWLKEYATKAGIKKRVYPHLLRHHKITAMAGSGMTESQIMVQSGHSDRRSLDTYTHLNTDSIKTIFNQV